MDTILSVLNKDFTGNRKVLAEVLRAIRKTKGHLHWQFLGIWQVLRGTILESLYVKRHTDRKQMGLLRAQCVEWKRWRLRYCCNQVWTMNGGRSPWNFTAICETFKIACSDGKTPYERRFWIPLNGPVIPFGAMVKYHYVSAKNLSRLHQFGPTVLPGIFLGYVLNAGEFGKRRHSNRRHRGTKSSTRKVNHGAITDTQSWYKILPLNGSSLIRVKKHRRRKRVYESFSSRHKSRKLFIRQFKGMWKIIWVSSMESPNFNTSSIRDKWHRWESRSTSNRRYCSSIVTIRIGWKMVWFYGMRNAIAICEMSKTSWQMGNLRMKDDLENHLKAQ